MNMLMNPCLIAPSILSANFSKLAEEVQSVEKGGADWIHIDVMDGHFVPNLTIGPVVVEALRPVTKLPLDCHLMIAQPEKWIEPFAKAGADWITVHAEATHHLDRLIGAIHELKCKAGVSINPATPVSAIKHVLNKADLVLIMSVNPGFGGQKFISESEPKVEELVSLREKSKGKSKFLIEIDGGINLDNIGSLKKLGCEVFVAGSAIFSQKDRKKIIQQMKEK